MCLFSLVLGLALFLPICSALLHLEARCAGLAAFQSVTMQASKVLLMKARRCSQGRPVSRGDFRDGTAGFCVLGSGLASGVVFPPQRGLLLLVPHPFFSRMDANSDKRWFLFFTCECIHFKGPFSYCQFKIKFKVSSWYQITGLAFYSCS